MVTPNIPEAQDLTGLDIAGDAEARAAAEAIIKMGARSVVIKGGHRSGPPTDLFYDGSRFREYTAERIPSVNTHGTGCTFASAVAAGLAHGLEVPAAVGTGQAVCHRRHSRRLPHRTGARPFAPLPFPLAVSAFQRNWQSGGSP